MTLSNIEDHKHANLILLAEIGALIHDIGKLSCEFILQQSIECYDDKTCCQECKFLHGNILKINGFLNPPLISLLEKMEWRTALKNNNLRELKNPPYHLGDFISSHHGKSRPEVGLLTLIRQCDRIDSGVDKGMLKQSAKQSCFGTYSATAFGYEQRLPIFRHYDRLEIARNEWAAKLYNSLENIINENSNLSDERSKILDATDEAFHQALGETRRAANDVTLWDHAYSVASLQKAALAKAFLSNEWPAEFRWRILLVNFNGLQFIEDANHISDLLGKQDLIHEALNNVRTLLELKLPMGNEIYSDENGNAFVVPDIENLLELKDNLGNSLCDLIKMEFGKNLYGDITINLTPNCISNSSRYSIELGKMLSNPLPPLSSDVEQVRRQWNDVRNEEICTVCKLRPMGKSQKSKDRHICDICEKRRSKRSKNWATEKLSTTIWTDEVADSYGRMALIIGSFDLKSWLDGRLLSTILGQEFPESMKYKEIITQLSEELENNVIPDNSNPSLIQQMAPEAFKDRIDAEKFCKALVEERDIHKSAIGTAKEDFNARAEILLRFLLSKNPSFARLRRIWETTRDFWQEVCPTDESKDLQESLVGRIVGLDGPRLEIRGTLQQKKGAETPGPYHAYDLVLSKGIKLSVAWDPEEGKQEEPKGRFITIDNLTHFVSLAGNKAPSRERDESEEDCSWRRHRWGAEKLKELIHGTIPIEESTGYGGKAKEWGEINVDCIDIIPKSRYTPAIPILAEPRTFMALVPADKALEAVDSIKTKYEREIGKVRNRHPLHLGIVYAHRRTPLRAILDAGRRMLEQSFRPEGWKVVCAARKLGSRNDPLPERFSIDKDGQFGEWLEILLEKDSRRVNWFVPGVMGDGQTPDHWYPFVFLNSSSEPLDRDRRFKAPNPWEGSDGWLVHAADLRTDDVVYFTPATMDFQWLDSAGRRFEIAYDDRGKRHGLSRRPYLLDELDTLNRVWHILSSHLTMNQIYILRDLIETKRTEWEIDDHRAVDDGIFNEFCCMALANAEWKNRELPWEAEGKDRKNWLDQWADYAVRGWITDAIELHLQIMKEEVQDEF